MNKAKNVVDFYVLSNKLKNIVRTGWLNWHVNASRVESIAEHIYGVQMLALAMFSEYEYDIDIKKVMFMLAIHELEEIIIGDLTFLQIGKEEKEKIGHEAVEKILSSLLKGEEIEKLIFEFDKGETEEARFAYYCDKLECDLQCKIYDENNNVKLDNQEEGEHPDEVMNKIRTGEASWSCLWMMHDRPIFTKDDNFTEVLDYAINEKIVNGNEVE